MRIALPRMSARKALVWAVVGAAALAMPLLSSPASPEPASLALTEDFSTDPKAGTDWFFKGAWRWKPLSENLMAKPTKRDLARWLPEQFDAGRLSADVKLVKTLTTKKPKAGLVFSFQPETGAYRSLLLKPGNPGKVILTQRGTIGGLETGTIARAPAPVKKRAWHHVELDFPAGGGLEVFLDSESVLVVDASALPQAQGLVGLRSVKSKAFFDNFTFETIDEPPVSCFEATPSPSLRGEEILFDSSCTQPGGGAIVLWEWDFDYDGAFSADASGETANHAYLTAGTHSAALRVTDDADPPQSNLATLQLTVEPDPPPSACFTLGPDPSLCGEEVAFDASCSVHPSPLCCIESWEWDFDYDGVFSTEAAGVTVSHSYGLIGAHTAALRVTDDGAPPQSDLATFQVTVQIVNTPPVPDAGGPYEIDRGSGLLLDGSGSVEPDAACGDSISGYQWDLDGDGTFGDRTGESCSLDWGEVETLICGGACLGGAPYGLALRVTDSLGAQATDLVYLTIYDNGPTACFEVAPEPVLCNELITFDASCSTHGHPAHTITQWEWDFDYGGEFGAQDSGETVIHSWPAMGSHEVALRVTDDNVPPKTALYSRTIDVEILNTAPTADAGGPYCSVAGLGLVLDASGSADPDSGCGDAVAAWEWDLDDDGAFDDALGETLLLDWTTIEAAVCGGACVNGVPYPVAVRVTDSLGASGTASSAFTATDNSAPAADAGGPYYVEAGDGLLLDASGSADPDSGCGDAVAAWEWDLDDDGAFDDALGQTFLLDWTTIEAAVCGGTCVNDVSYPVAVRVTDSLGASGTAPGTVTPTQMNSLVCSGCHAGSPPPGSELAPDVMIYWDGSWWDLNKGGTDLTQQGGHGDPDGRPAATCTGVTGCHDLRRPDPSVFGLTHRDGIAQGKGVPSTNTYHLRDGFVEPAPVNAWDLQLGFDNFCYAACHQGQGLYDMRHAKHPDAENPEDVWGAAQFGQHGSVADGDGIIPPIDSDLSSLASTEEPDFMACVSCHDPHGTRTSNTSGKRPSNIMLRANWVTTGTLCLFCHQ